MASKTAQALAQKRLDAFILRGRERIEVEHTKRLGGELSNYFLGLSRRLRLPAQAKEYAFDRIALKVREVKAGETGAQYWKGVIDWDLEEQRLAKIVGKSYVNVGKDVYDGVSSALGVELNFSTSPYFPSIVMSEVASAVTNINDSTRYRVQQTIQDGLKAGSSPQTIAKSLVQQIQGWGGGPNKSTIAHSRAMVVARTETAVAYNRSAISAYKQSTIIQKVKVLDAPTCGWTSHDDPDSAQGKIVTLDEAKQHPVAHPNCVRAFAPVVATFDKPAPKPQEAAKPKAPPKPKAPTKTDRYANPKEWDTNDSWNPRTGGMARWADDYAKRIPRQTGKQHTALTTYQGSGYRGMNSFARERAKGIPASQTSYGPRYGEHYNELKTYIDKAPGTPEAVKVYRGSGTGSHFKDQISDLAGTRVDNPSEDDWRTLIGTTQREHGFMSTAMSKDSAFGGQVRLELTVPKGTKAIPLNNRVLADPSAPPTYLGSGIDDYYLQVPEAELLIQAGAEYVIDNVIMGNYGSVRIIGRIL